MRLAQLVKITSNCLSVMFSSLPLRVGKISRGIFARAINWASFSAAKQKILFQKRTKFETWNNYRKIPPRPLSNIDLSIIEANWIVFMGSKLSLFDNKIIIGCLLRKLLAGMRKFWWGKIKFYCTRWNCSLLLM